MINYKNKWQENSLNIEFWKEILIGRLITNLEFDNFGLKYFVLDNGEKIYPFDNTILIQTEDRQYISSFYDSGMNFSSYSKLSEMIKNLPEDSFISDIKYGFENSNFIQVEKSKFL
jgi:hypothetical protein